MTTVSTPVVIAALVAAVCGVPVAAVAQGQDASRPTGVAPRAVERAAPNDNRLPAGRRAGRAVHVTLEPRAARWNPLPAVPGLDRTVLAWAEAGGAPRVPGPLLRARVGDTLHLTLRNPLDRALAVVGLGDPGSAAARDTLRIAPGDSVRRAVVLTRAGSFWYDAVTRRGDDPAPPASPFPDKHHPEDETLLGAFVVDDAAGPPPGERVFVLHTGFRAPIPSLDTLSARLGAPPDVAVYVNGTAWPATERLRYAVGDTVRWRLINAAFLPHPMHLHGFYFRVDARGDAARDTVYATSARRMAVTELMDGFTTARLTWRPERAGNWLFHCHLLNHMAPVPLSPRVMERVRALAAALAARDSAAGGGDAHAAHAGHRAAGAADPTAAMHGHMAGLVFGVHVAGRTAAVRRSALPARALDLWVTERASATGAPPALGYVLQEGPAAPARDSVRRPGTPIVLTRGAPVAITVHNTRAVPVAVHWHGMELESRYDGVAGWSGAGRSVTPAIPPGGTFTARFTPPRAGTFIYHTHDERGPDLAAGLYGALVVHAPGAKASERLVVLGAGTATPAGQRRPTPFVNGDTGVAPVALDRARPTTLRVINISGNDLKHLRLLDSAGAPLRWRVVGKDGWTPPARQRAEWRAASLFVGVGETYDLEVAAADARRAAALAVETRFYPGSPRVLVHEARVPVRVAAR